MQPRIIIGIVAENNAGKSSIARALATDGAHFSVRGTIHDRYERLHESSAPKERHLTQAFAQAQKSLHGPETFLRETIEKFLATDHSICVIESLRAPGEAHWFVNEAHQHFPDTKTILIGITAPYEHRLERFFAGRPDELAADISQAEFDRQEHLVNKGETHWEENIATTIAHAHNLFDNANGKLDEVIKEIKAYIQTHY